MNGGEALIEALKSAGASHIFGLLGSSTMEAYDALYDERVLKYIGVRDERAGLHMADAFGRISGCPGVFLAGQAGPGSSNMVTGLAQALIAYSPVVAITGLVSSGHLGRDAFQEIDQQSLFKPVTKRTITVPRADRIPEFIQEAFRLANSGRRGPVVVQIPRDYFAESIKAKIPKATDISEVIPSGIDQQTVERICAMFREARTPVILAGAGIKWGGGSNQLANLAGRLRIPVVASAGHSDVLANDHPMFFGQVGPRGNPVASRLTREADLILALGTRLGFNTTFYNYADLSQTGRIVQVDIASDAIGRYFPVALGVVADATSVITSIDQNLIAADECVWSDWVEQALEDRKNLMKERDRDGADIRKPLRASRVFKEIRDVLPRDAIVTLDAGTMRRQATDQLRYFSSPSLLTPLDFGLVGFSYAAGLGAKAAAPNRPVVTLMGDGGFGMTMAEITTAVQHGLSTVAIVLDNGCWGAEKAYQRDFYNGRYVGSEIISPAYDQVAKLCGARGYAVEAPDELSSAVSDALQSGEPSVIHVKVDPEAMISFRRDSFKHRVSS